MQVGDFFLIGLNIWEKSWEKLSMVWIPGLFHGLIFRFRGGKRLWSQKAIVFDAKQEIIENNQFSGWVLKIKIEKTALSPMGISL